MELKYKTINTNKITVWPLQEVKDYLRISHGYDDTLIKSLIETSVEYAENFTGLSIHKREIVCHASRLDQIFYVKHAPVISVLSAFKILSQQRINITENFGTFNYEASMVKINSSYIGQNIEIKYRCGFDADKVPNILKIGMLKHISSMYELNEGGVNSMTDIHDLYSYYRKIKI